MKAENILLTTDFSKESQLAYPAAGFLARKLGGRVHLAHVAERPAHFYFSTGFGAAMTAGDFHQELSEHLGTEAKHEAFKDVEVQTHLVTDKPLIDGLRQLEKDLSIDLAVLSSHGRSGLGYAFLGSTAEKVVRSLAAPVLTYRRPESGEEIFPPQRIVVPFDFSENARAVLPAIQTLARDFSPQFFFTFAVEPVYPVVAMPSGYAYPATLEQKLRETPQLVEKLFDELRKNDLQGIDAKLELSEGQPASQILEKAKSLSADLVLMSTHGWTGVESFFLGSVAERVARLAPCSVLTVRAST